MRAYNATHTHGPRIEWRSGEIGVGDTGAVTMRYDGRMLFGRGIGGWG